MAWCSTLGSCRGGCPPGQYCPVLPQILGTMGCGCVFVFGGEKRGGGGGNPAGMLGYIKAWRRGLKAALIPSPGGRGCAGGLQRLFSPASNILHAIWVPYHSCMLRRGERGGGPGQTKFRSWGTFRRGETEMVPCNLWLKRYYQCRGQLTYNECAAVTTRLGHLW